jgi:putative hemolysin
MVDIFILLFLIILNGLFVLAEIALVSSRKARLEGMSEKGNKKAKAALDLANHPDVFLPTAQIGITLISIVTGIYSGEKFSKNLEPYIAKISFLESYATSISTAIIVIIVTFLSIIFGELIPKRIGITRAEKIACLVAKPVLFLSKATSPLVWILNKTTNFLFRIFGIHSGQDNIVTEEEIKAIISEGTEHGTIDEAEQEIIERVFHLGDRNITSLMTHRSDIVWLNMHNKLAEVTDIIKNSPHSVYPLCDAQIDEIKGVIHVKDLFLAKEDTALKTLMRTALFVPDNNTAYQVLEKFKETKIHSCFIVDEYGTMQGMITLNDILEAIVGDIPASGQEDDYEIIERKDGTFLVDAQIPFYDFLEKFEKADWIKEIEQQEYDTLAGFILHELEHIPVTGETIAWRGFDFEILDMDGHRIDKVLVTINQEIRNEMDENA